MENKTAITYREEDHSYWKGSLRVPGISELLKYFGYIDDTYYTEVARDVGIAVHAGVSSICRGEHSAFELENPLIISRIEAFLKFQKEKGFTPAQVEAIQFSPIANLACRVDLIGVFADSKTPVIVELKCGSKAKWHGLQVSAQALCSGMTPIRRFVLYLKPDGKYSLCEHSNRVEIQLVQSLAALYWYNFRQGITLKR